MKNETIVKSIYYILILMLISLIIAIVLCSVSKNTNILVITVCINAGILGLVIVFNKAHNNLRNESIDTKMNQIVQYLTIAVSAYKDSAATIHNTITKEAVYDARDILHLFNDHSANLNTVKPAKTHDEIPDHIIMYDKEMQSIFNAFLQVIQQYHKVLQGLYAKLDTLCPVHLPLDLESEWREFIAVRFNSSFESLKYAITSIQTIQNESIEYVQYVLELLKGFKNKRALLHEQIAEFYTGMRNKQESFAQYLATVSETFAFIKEIMVQIEEITDKINILSLNMSIEANKLTGNNVFTVIAKELHAFSEQTIKYFDPIKKAIEQNLSSIEEKKKEEQDTIEQIQHFMIMSENLIKENERNIDEFTNLIDGISKSLISRDNDVKSHLLGSFKDMQNLAIVQEEVTHYHNFNAYMIQKVNSVVQVLIREHKICQGIECQYRIDSFKLLENLITTADERAFLKLLYKKYLQKELEDDEHKKGDVIFFDTV